MKIVVVSDIHGGFLEFEKIIEQEPFDKLVVLGDLFSYGFHGSDSKPRSFSSKSYLVFLENKLIIKSIEGNILKEYKIGI